MKRDYFELESKLKLAQGQVLAFSRDFAVLYRQEREERQKLEEMNEKLLAIMNSMSDGLIATDRNFQILDFNLRASEYFPILKESDEHQYVGQIIPNEILQQKVVELLISNRSLVRFELEHETDRTQFFSVTMTQLNRNSNNYMGFLFTFRDITEVKHIEKLRKRVVQLATLEVEVPFRGLIGLMDLLLENVQDRLTSEELKYFKFLRQSRENLQKILHQMIHLNPNEQESELEKSLVQVDGLILEVLSEFDSDFNILDMTVSFELANPGAVWLDRDLMRKALVVLVRELISSINESVEMSIVLEQKEENLELCFTCSGIPESEKECIIRTLNQPSKWLDTLDQTGIDLPLARDIIEWNGAELQLSKSNDFELKIVFPVWIKIVKEDREE